MPNPPNLVFPCSLRDDSADGLTASLTEALEPLDPNSPQLLLLPPVSPQQQSPASSSGQFGRRPDTRERSNGRVALTVLKPKTLEALGEEAAEAEAEATLREESSRRGGDSSEPASPHKGSSEGDAKKGGATVPLKVGLCPREQSSVGCASCLLAYAIQPYSFPSALTLLTRDHLAAPLAPSLPPSGVPGSQAAEAGHLL